MRLLDEVHGPTPDAVVEAHVAVPKSLPADRALVRLDMITSVDGASAVSGLSGGLGNRDDRAVFNALRAVADVVLVGLGTAIAEHYHASDRPDLQIYVIADRPAIDGNEALFASGRATLVLPVDAPSAPAGVPELRAGADGVVDLEAVVAQLAGRVAVLEGGPSLAGLMLSRGLVDEFFVTVSPRVVAGEAARIAHGPDADPSPWTLEHGFVDDDGFLFLRYGRREVDQRAG
jgi:riboflavin biosynthesis pyrimidine reductase